MKEKLCRTDKKLCVGKKNGYDVYRTVYTDGVRCFIKWNNQTIDVTDDSKNFISK